MLVVLFIYNKFMFTNCHLKKIQTGCFHHTNFSSMS